MKRPLYCHSRESGNLIYKITASILIVSFLMTNVSYGFQPTDNLRGVRDPEARTATVDVESLILDHDDHTRKLDTDLDRAASEDRLKRITQRDLATDPALQKLLNLFRQAKLYKLAQALYSLAGAVDVKGRPGLQRFTAKAEEWILQDENGRPHPVNGHASDSGITIRAGLDPMEEAAVLGHELLDYFNITANNVTAEIGPHSDWFNIVEKSFIHVGPFFEKALMEALVTDRVEPLLPFKPYLVPDKIDIHKRPPDLLERASKSPGERHYTSADRKYVSGLMSKMNLRTNDLSKEPPNLEIDLEVSDEKKDGYVVFFHAGDATIELGSILTRDGKWAELKICAGPEDASHGLYEALIRYAFGYKLTQVMLFEPQWRRLVENFREWLPENVLAAHSLTESAPTSDSGPPRPIRDTGNTTVPERDWSMGDRDGDDDDAYVDIVIGDETVSVMFDNRGRSDAGSYDIHIILPDESVDPEIDEVILGRYLDPERLTDPFHRHLIAFALASDMNDADPMATKAMKEPAWRGFVGLFWSFMPEEVQEAHEGADEEPTSATPIKDTGASTLPEESWERQIEDPGSHDCSVQIGISGEAVAVYFSSFYRQPGMIVSHFNIRIVLLDKPGEQDESETELGIYTDLDKLNNDFHRRLIIFALGGERIQRGLSGPGWADFVGHFSGIMPAEVLKAHAEEEAADEMLDRISTATLGSLPAETDTSAKGDEPEIVRDGFPEGDTSLEIKHKGVIYWLRFGKSGFVDISEQGKPGVWLAVHTCSGPDNMGPGRVRPLIPFAFALRSVIDVLVEPEWADFVRIFWDMLPDEVTEAHETEDEEWAVDCGRFQHDTGSAVVNCGEDKYEIGFLSGKRMNQILLTIRQDGTTIGSAVEPKGIKDPFHRALVTEAFQDVSVRTRLEDAEWSDFVECFERLMPTEDVAQRAVDVLMEEIWIESDTAAGINEEDGDIEIKWLDNSYVVKIDNNITSQANTIYVEKPSKTAGGNNILGAYRDPENIRDPLHRALIIRALHHEAILSGFRRLTNWRDFTARFMDLISIEPASLGTIDKDEIAMKRAMSQACPAGIDSDGVSLDINRGSITYIVELNNNAPDGQLNMVVEIDNAPWATTFNSISDIIDPIHISLLTYALNDDDVRDELMNAHWAGFVAHFQALMPETIVAVQSGDVGLPGSAPAAAKATEAGSAAGVADNAVAGASAGPYDLMHKEMQFWGTEKGSGHAIIFIKWGADFFRVHFHNRTHNRGVGITIGPQKASDMHIEEALYRNSGDIEYEVHLGLIDFAVKDPVMCEYLSRTEFDTFVARFSALMPETILAAHSGPASLADARAEKESPYAALEKAISVENVTLNPNSIFFRISYENTEFRVGFFNEAHTLGSLQIRVATLRAEAERAEPSAYTGPQDVTDRTHRAFIYFAAKHVTAFDRLRESDFRTFVEHWSALMPPEVRDAHGIVLDGKTLADSLPVKTAIPEDAGDFTIMEESPGSKPAVIQLSQVDPENPSTIWYIHIYDRTEVPGSKKESPAIEIGISTATDPYQVVRIIHSYRLIENIAFCKSLIACALDGPKTTEALKGAEWKEFVKVFWALIASEVCAVHGFRTDPGEDTVSATAVAGTGADAPAEKDDTKTKNAKYSPSHVVVEVHNVRLDFHYSISFNRDVRHIVMRSVRPIDEFVVPNVYSSPDKIPPADDHYGGVVECALRDKIVQDGLTQAEFRQFVEHFEPRMPENVVRFHDIAGRSDRGAHVGTGTQMPPTGLDQAATLRLQVELQRREREEQAQEDDRVRQEEEDERRRAEEALRRAQASAGVHVGGAVDPRVQADIDRAEKERNAAEPKARQLEAARKSGKPKRAKRVKTIQLEEGQELEATLAKRHKQTSTFRVILSDGRRLEATLAPGMARSDLPKTGRRVTIKVTFAKGSKCMIIGVVGGKVAQTTKPEKRTTERERPKATLVPLVVDVPESLTLPVSAWRNLLNLGKPSLEVGQEFIATITEVISQQETFRVQLDGDGRQIRANLVRMPRTRRKDLVLGAKVNVTIVTPGKVNATCRIESCVMTGELSDGHEQAGSEGESAGRTSTVVVKDAMAEWKGLAESEYKEKLEEFRRWIGKKELKEIKAKTLMLDADAVIQGGALIDMDDALNEVSLEVLNKVILCAEDHENAGIIEKLIKEINDRIVVHTVYKPDLRIAGKPMDTAIDEILSMVEHARSQGMMSNTEELLGVVTGKVEIKEDADWMDLLRFQKELRIPVVSLKAAGTGALYSFADALYAILANQETCKPGGILINLRPIKEVEPPRFDDYLNSLEPLRAV